MRAKAIGATIRDFGAAQQRRAKAAEAECERLRGLLSIARGGLQVALSFVTVDNETSGTSRAVIFALRRSDPDATEAETSHAD